MGISSLAGKSPPSEMLVDIEKLIKAYYENIPDSSVSTQRVEFGTSGHRGSSFDSRFNELHILAITQAICFYRLEKGIDGPLFLGIDTHALSKPAFKTALEVLAANGITVMLSEKSEYTPTPVISHAILSYNKGRKDFLADGIVITPSHNPPDQGGFKYNSTNGGPADPRITNWIQDKANELLENNLKEVKKISFEKAIAASTTKKHNYIKAYVDDLENVIDMEIIQKSKIHMGVNPLGGAGVDYWKAIAKRYNLNLTVIDDTVDPTFSFMRVDRDGKIRMDPSSSYAMQGLIEMKDAFAITCACDTDHDRHGIITRSSGLLPPNHYLSVAVYYLFQNRPKWSKSAVVGKTLVSSQMIDRVAKKLGRKLYEVPVGFKWFVEGLLEGYLAFGGEESAGASFARLDGTTWTTDKDGILLSLLAAEMTAKLGKDPGLLYLELVKEFGNPVYDRITAPVTAEQKKRLKNLSSENIQSQTLADEKITAILTKAPGNNAPIGGLKVVAENGWFAARPSGTEDIYKIYAESFLGPDHLKLILKEAEMIVNKAIE